MSRKQVFCAKNKKCGFFVVYIKVFHVRIKINVRLPPPFFSFFSPTNSSSRQLVATNRRDVSVDSHISRKAWAITV